MTPADLAAAARALTGSPDRWRRPLARMLGCSEGFVRQMANGERPVPAGVQERLGELVAERRRELAKVPTPTRARPAGSRGGRMNR